jgi:hypothetical protein
LIEAVKFLFDKNTQIFKLTDTEVESYPVSEHDIAVQKWMIQILAKKVPPEDFESWRGWISATLSKTDKTLKVHKK